MSDLKRTPLCEQHIKLNAKMVDFAGWYLPVQYIGIKEEHLNVRNHVGLFDVSHMGEIRFKGSRAMSSLEWLTTNLVSKLSDGDAQYSLLPNCDGGLVDDIIIYCLKKNEDYLVCVNASNREKDFNWIKQNNRGAELYDESEEWAQIAVQGPKANDLILKSLKFDLRKVKAFTIHTIRFQGTEMLLATTGYTGESGCEIFVRPKVASDLWSLFLIAGKDFNIMPIGLGARDTLRMEMKYSLYGHEIDDSTNPFEAQLGWVVKSKEKEFLGKNNVLAQTEAIRQKILVGFKMQEKVIPRQGYGLYDSEESKIGQVTSGTLLPTSNECVGIGYVDKQFSSFGREVFVDIRGKKRKGIICKTPFLTKG